MSNIEIVRNAIEQLEVVAISGMDRNMIKSNKEIAKIQLQKIIGSTSIKKAKKYLDNNLKY